MNLEPLLKASYLIYIMIFFKTKYSINHPVEIWLQDQNFDDFFKHPITTTQYENRVCPLGKIVALALAIWILIRSTLKGDRSRWNQIVWNTVMVGSLVMNLNVFVYLLPVYLLESR